MFTAAGLASPHIGVAIGDRVLDVHVLAAHGVFPDAAVAAALQAPLLNPFMSLGRPQWKAARAIITELLSEGCATLRDNAALCGSALLAMRDVTMCMPAQIGDYTDFYSSRQHAFNVGVMFRGAANALQPNWLHLPVGYHGRSSSIVVSGTDIVRPMGQLCADDVTPTCRGGRAPCSISNSNSPSLSAAPATRWDRALRSTRQANTCLACAS